MTLFYLGSGRLGGSRLQVHTDATESSRVEFLGQYDIQQVGLVDRTHIRAFLLLSTKSIFKHFNRSLQHFRSFRSNPTRPGVFVLSQPHSLLKSTIYHFQQQAKMQYTATISYLLYAASVAVAAPIEARQFGLGGGGSTRNDIVDGKCAPVTFIFARGSTEPGV